MPEVAQLRYGVTGTDTGIGKTVVACALAARARQLGVRVAAMKPIETGLDPAYLQPGASSDAERLRDACGGGDSLSLVRPYALNEALAPMVAAQRAGVEIDLGTLDAACDMLSPSRQLILVEGAGGLLVPIRSGFSYLDLFSRWRCALIIVAGNRLGVLNHVLLTVRAAETAGVPVRALILTQHSDRDLGVAAATNYDALVSLLPGYDVFRFPWVDRTDDLDALAVAAAGSGLDVLVDASLESPAFGAHSLTV